MPHVYGPTLARCQYCEYPIRQAPQAETGVCRQCTPYHNGTSQLPRHCAPYPKFRKATQEVNGVERYTIEFECCGVGAWTLLAPKNQTGFWWWSKEEDRDAFMVEAENYLLRIIEHHDFRDTRRKNAIRKQKGLPPVKGGHRKKKFFKKPWVSTMMKEKWAKHRSESAQEKQSE